MRAQSVVRAQSVAGPLAPAAAGPYPPPREPPLPVVWIILAPLLLAAAIVGNNRLVVSRHAVDLPGLQCPVRVVHLSDLHAKRFGAGSRRLLGPVAALSPDLIAVSGDLLRRHHDVSPRAIRQLCSLARIAPVAVCRGNHDLNPRQWRTLVDSVRGLPVHVLQNEVTRIDVGVNSLTVAGIDDRAVYGRDAGGYLHELDALAARAAALPAPRILLAHRPEYIDAYARAGFHLSFSGHAHGGQIRLPLVGPLWAPEQGFFPRRTSGIHRIGALSAAVSRGLGPSSFPFRVLNPPEIVVVEARP